MGLEAWHTQIKYRPDHDVFNYHTGPPTAFQLSLQSMQHDRSSSPETWDQGDLSIDMSPSPLTANRSSPATSAAQLPSATSIETHLVRQLSMLATWRMASPFCPLDRPLITNTLSRYNIDEVMQLSCAHNEHDMITVIKDIIEMEHIRELGLIYTRSLCKYVTFACIYDTVQCLEAIVRHIPSTFYANSDATFMHPIIPAFLCHGQHGSCFRWFLLKGLIVTRQQLTTHVLNTIEYMDMGRHFPYRLTELISYLDNSGIDY